MTGPWEDYASPAPAAQSAGPWEDYAAAQRPAATPTGSLWDNIKSLPGGIVQGLASAASASGQAAQTEMGEPVTAPGPEESAKLLEQHVTGELPNTGIYGRRIGEALGNPASYVAPGGPLVKTGLAALSGAGQAGGEQLTGSPWGGVAGGLLAPLSAGAVTRAVANQAIRSATPTTARVLEASDAGYTASRGLGVEVKAAPVHQLSDDILSDLHTDGFRERNVPKTWSAVQELKDIGPTATVDDVDSVRKVLTRAGANATDAAEREASGRAKGMIDDWWRTLDESDTAVNGHFLPKLVATMEEARGNWAKGKLSQMVEDAADKAEGRASATGSGANVDNATRQEANRILNSKRLSRGLTSADRTALEAVRDGTFRGNAARYLGKFAPTGIVSGGIGSEIGRRALGTLGELGLPLAGYAAKKIGDIGTQNRLRDFAGSIRARSPLGLRSNIPAAPPPLSRYALPGLGNVTNPFDENQ